LLHRISSVSSCVIDILQVFSRDISPKSPARCVWFILGNFLPSLPISNRAKITECFFSLFDRLSLDFYYCNIAIAMLAPLLFSKLKSASSDPLCIPVLILIIKDHFEATQRSPGFLSPLHICALWNLPRPLGVQDTKIPGNYIIPGYSQLL
jgi:hypothetical protein